MTLRNILVYILTILIVASAISFNFLGISTSLQGQLSLAVTFLLALVGFRQFIKNQYSKVLLLYLVAILLQLTFSKDPHLSYIARLWGPFLIFTMVDKRNNKWARPLFYFFIALFVANASVALYERITEVRIVPVDVHDEILQNQMENYVDDDFRAFAFFGHPLTNANIMAFMTFAIFFTKSIPLKIRATLTALGFASLFAFNSRGSILISGILLLPSIFMYLKANRRRRFLSIVVIAILFIVVAANFQSFGGRLISTDINDNSALVRVLSLNEFMSYSFNDLLIGGITMKYGENGYLMTLAYYGLIIGSIKIFVEIYMAYKMIDKAFVPSKIERAVMMLSLIAIGSTNNNLYYPIVVPLYVLFITFVVNNQNLKVIVRMQQQRKKEDKKALFIR